MASRRNQPYRRGRGRPAGQTLAAQLRGRSGTGTNRMDEFRKLARGGRYSPRRAVDPKGAFGPTASTNPPRSGQGAVVSELPGQGRSRAGRRSGPLGMAGSKPFASKLRDRLRSNQARRNPNSRMDRNLSEGLRRANQGRGGAWHGRAQKPKDDFDVSSAVAGAQQKETVSGPRRKNTNVNSARYNETFTEVRRRDGTIGHRYKGGKTVWLKKKRGGRTSGGRTSGTIPVG